MNKHEPSVERDGQQIMGREFWDERFRTKDYVYGMAPNDFLAKSHQRITESGHVLCIAEGEGRNAVFLARNGFDVSAIDISIEGKMKAERLASKNGVSIDFKIADVGTYDFGENKWDAIVSIFAIIGSTQAQRTSVFQQMQDALKPGGVVILEAYHPRQLEYGTGGPKDINLLIALDELRAIFDEKNMLHQASLERKVVEGSFHTGDAFVTQLVYEKPRL